MYRGGGECGLRGYGDLNDRARLDVATRPIKPTATSVRGAMLELIGQIVR
jgi:hypothetical protein